MKGAGRTILTYMFAPSSVVDNETMAELSQYGNVQRIPGSTPQEISVGGPDTKIVGPQNLLPVGYRPRGVGWEYAEPGNNLFW